MIEVLRAQHPLFLTLLGLFPVAAGAYGVSALRRRGDLLRRVASVLYLAAFAASTALIAALWVQAGRPPFKSLFESLILFVWCTSLIYLVIERYYKIAWLGAVSALFLALVCGYALMKADVEQVNLPAALQSVWFVPHVVVYFIGYGALFFAFVAAILHLVRPNTVLTVQTSGGDTREMSWAGLMHLTILLGFVMLTGGLLMGAVWAKVAWGDYWVWDPKENWALVSWLVFAIYLHVCRTKGYSDKTGAIITIVGFLAIVFTYLGMHLLPTAEQSAHVYQ